MHVGSTILHGIKAKDFTICTMMHIYEEDADEEEENEEVMGKTIPMISYSQRVEKQ